MEYDSDRLELVDLDCALPVSMDENLVHQETEEKAASSSTNETFPIKPGITSTGKLKS